MVKVYRVFIKFIRYASLPLLFLVCAGIGLGIISTLNHHHIGKSLGIQTENNLSTLKITTGDNIKIGLSDSKDRITGYDPTSQKIVEEIPGSTFYKDYNENGYSLEIAGTLHVTDGQFLYNILVSNFTESLRLTLYPKAQLPEANFLVYVTDSTGKQTTIPVINKQTGSPVLNQYNLILKGGNLEITPVN